MLPVIGGCPQGSLLSVLLFNVSIDDVELSAAQKLEELDRDDVDLGEFFDRVDREYLSNANVNIGLNNGSDLIPNINIQSNLNEESDAPAFANNGDSVVLQTGICLLYTSPSPRD